MQWECRATMDGDYKFGKLDVLCEGYDYPFDPYVLKGSCGVSMNLFAIYLFISFPYSYTYF